ncbi:MULTISPECIES: hypothetical protein [unclassified Bradyrhizobium]|uniref:hypothetical protein n=1 Tax=unclassified Bradyrhizobium TaxID=2631580 RepID=UPI0028E521AF|nr:MULTISPECIES: hypothetical protein [unclassified Bradyrhizobium]
MVSVQRRLNSTGRKRIIRDRIRIELTPPLDTFSFPTATAEINLAEMDLDPAAGVTLEAYYRSSSMRFPCGTVASIDVPPRFVLTDVDRGGAIQFRLLVIASDNSGRILASAEGIKPRQKSDTPERQPLLRVRETDLGEELWRIDLNERNGPWLLINSRVPGLAMRLRSDVLVQGLILPHALREVIRNLPREGEDEDDQDWGDDWRKFLRALDVEPEPDDPQDEESVQSWVEDAVIRFSQLKRFAELVRAASLQAEGDHG